MPSPTRHPAPTSDAEATPEHPSRSTPTDQDLSATTGDTDSVGTVGGDPARQALAYITLRWEGSALEVSLTWVVLRAWAATIHDPLRPLARRAVEHGEGRLLQPLAAVATPSGAALIPRYLAHAIRRELQAARRGVSLVTVHHWRP